MNRKRGPVELAPHAVVCPAAACIEMLWCSA